MTRISLLCLAISIVFSQAVHAQPSIRLGAGGSKLGGETDDLIVSNFSLGYNVMAGLESPLSPSASILLECAYVSNKFDGFLVNLSGSQSIIQANVGIKLSSHFLRETTTIGF